ncbi:uncharacterized protein LOC143908538 [Temnothorax americanus]|uniref:uncharacterized protein LOC143908538 n=1 Tax=Temnothorax americanus TaxID=1964332 RepID=UPI0040683E53
MKRSFGGRPRHKCWEDQKFLPIQDEVKTVAYCCLCKNILKNTSQVRLQMHRKNCHEKSDSVVVVSGEMLLNSESELNAEDAEVVEVVEVAEPLIDNSDNKANLLKLKQKQKKNKTSNTQIRPFLDKISDKDEVRINEAFMKFFCGCNVPFEAVESDHFLNLMKTMRPAYKPPTKEMLKNSFLHNLHKQLITDESTLVNSDGILMIKQTSFQNSKQIVTFAKTVQGKIFYLKS